MHTLQSTYDYVGDSKARDWCGAAAMLVIAALLLLPPAKRRCELRGPADKWLFVWPRSSAMTTHRSIQPC